MVALGLAGAVFLFFLLANRRRLGFRLPTRAAARPAATSSEGEPAGPTWASFGGDESALPRWLRPSVRAARFLTSPADAPSARSSVNFPESETAFGTRMAVRFDDVTLLDEKNEVYASILGRLKKGDEVDVHHTEDAWALVETPGGLTGWVQVMALKQPSRRAAAARSAKAEKAAKAVTPPIEPTLADAAAEAAMNPEAAPLGRTRHRFPLGRRIAKAADLAPSADMPPLAEAPGD